jgi:D-arginine dehydrogenase
VPDIVVIGGGIAGISAAAHLSAYGAVTLVEKESVLAYHSTGRSAALYFVPYGSSVVHPLTRASRSFLTEPPPDLVDAPLLTPRGALLIARADQHDLLDKAIDEDEQGCFERLTAEEVVGLQPLVRDDYVAAGLYDQSAMDMDVAGLHQAYVRMFRANGGEFEMSAPVTTIEGINDSWKVSTSTATVTADVVVNAAGAWGDVIAGCAGIKPIGLEPLRRTAFMVASDPSLSEAPITGGFEAGFYFKPDGPQMLCSLAEEEPDEPGDPQPREIDVALAIDRINTATTLDIRHVRSSWVGLRTFAPDRAPVLGFDPQHQGFFWSVGHGGTGIQMAPATARLVEGLVIEGIAPSDLIAEGLDVSAVSADRIDR